MKSYFEALKAYIEQNNTVTIKQLQSLFPEVSLMTIHRDLDALEDKIIAFCREKAENGDCPSAKT